MWELSAPWWELVIRAVVIYVVVFVLFRLVGKKQLGQVSPFDFVLLLLVSESISAGLAGGDHSLTGAIISASTFLTLNRVIDYFAFKNSKIERILDGRSKVIVENGKINEKVRCDSHITYEELLSAIREQGIEKLKDVKIAILETNGRITAVEI